ncbi:malto-oligosyltrehalose synthase [Xanthobacter agilis]|uniref:(1->4)-alpha-D-glucan 1-alpha-D-glucosylmutase n=1 Tax=Xanthobacter agilis TaxID=47492 RepID=A0ABU0LFK4_XANAG|nr:malto-oligosyltrehalose synthase [Xanthobacter agilis]MDQ0505929.1 (1->4)-alpha-D-glucan 1-alpha-D-glucosylmutase [Xanthobacter agilis]
MTPPHGAVRLQIDSGFPLDAAAAQVDYFADLGLSHMAISPLLSSRPGLFGGVVDHATVDPRIGGEEGLHRLVHELRRRHMGLIVDVTPAAMAVGGDDNDVWRDLMEWGRDSAHAHWLDVDWRSADASLRNRLLLPFLDRPYGAALQDGALQLAFDSARGVLLVRHREHAFPICPLDYAAVLEAAGLADAAALAAPFAGLSRLRPSAEQVAAARRELSAKAAGPEGRALVAAAVGAFDPRTDPGRARLHHLLERQNYRLAWWGTAADALNWRRLPDTTALAALRMERPDVFDATHGTLLRLYGEGLLDGFVIRQWDLLADPAGYARRLRLKLETQAHRGATARPAAILIADTVPIGDALPEGWDVAGTAGAEVQDALSAVLHDAGGGGALSDLWIGATGERQRLDEQQAAARRQALRTIFGAQLDGAVQALHEVAEADLATRDATRAALARVVSEVAIALPVPRTYGDLDGFAPADTALFAAALKRARRQLSPADALVADHVSDWLGGVAPRSVRDFEQAGAREQAIAAVQQLTAALAQVSTDEMLFSRYGRLISRNEAGADLSQAGLRPDAFHARMTARAARSPHAFTPTGGPGQRLGEDTRMRIAVLSEAPRDWEPVLRHFLESTQPFRSRLVDGVAPEPADTVVLAQALVGVWPSALEPDDALGLADLHSRLRAWWLNVVRAARRRTDPHFGDADYEAGCMTFLAALLESPDGLPARRMIADHVPRLVAAGTLNALSQTVLKCTVPGVPELFQGCEFWDQSLGAIDQARAVDYRARAHGLTTGDTPDQMLESPQDGRVKQAVLGRLLHLRAAWPALFHDGDYLPLTVEGRHAPQVLAFARRHRDQAAVTVVTRLAAHLLDGPSALAPPAVPRVPPSRWGDTCVPLPGLGDGSYRDALTGRDLECRHGRILISEALHSFPAAVLLKA